MFSFSLTFLIKATLILLIPKKKKKKQYKWAGDKLIYPYLGETITFSYRFSE